MDEEQENDPGLTPADEARVRAALAAAGTDEPMPQDVVSRLDAVLAGLVAEREPTAAPAQPYVAPAATGRRRSPGRYLLVAAAVLAVVAVGVPTIRGITGGSATSSAGSSEAASSSASAEPPPSLRQSAPDSSPLPVLPAPGSAAPLALGTTTFRVDVRRVLLGLETRRAAGQDAATCGGSPSVPGVSFTRQVLLDRSPALLEVFPAKDGRRLVRAVSCDGSRTLASARVPAP